MARVELKKHRQHRRNSFLYKPRVPSPAKRREHQIATMRPLLECELQNAFLFADERRIALILVTEQGTTNLLLGAAQAQMVADKLVKAAQLMPH